MTEESGLPLAVSICECDLSLQSRLSKLFTCCAGITIAKHWSSGDAHRQAVRCETHRCDARCVLLRYLFISLEDCVCSLDLVIEEMNSVAQVEMV